MKVSILVLNALALVSAAAEPEEQSSALLVLDTGNRLAGVTYAESFDMNMTTSIEMMGETTQMTMYMQMESETTPTNLEQGGQSIHMHMTHIAYQADFGYMKMECDTAEEQDQQDEEEQGFCSMFYDLIADENDMDFVVDDEGRIAESSAPDERVKSSGAADHLQASARLLQFIPTRPIRQGESWDSSMEMDGLGYFEGTSKFLGLDAEHGNCALVSIVGTLDIDFQALMDKMGSQMNGMGEDDISITNSVMAAKTCWDDESKLTVWSQTDMSFTMHMANPMDPQQDLAMPIQETIRTTCEIKET